MRRVRLITGLVIASFVVGHFLNHAAGVVSIDAMEQMRAGLARWWRSAPGTALLYGSAATHFLLALASLYRRSTLRMPAWEAAQILLGLAVPPLLVGHVVGTRFAWLLLEHDVGYPRVLGVLWSETWGAARQSLLLLAVWAHLCLGLHYWLRLKPWYPSVQPVAFAAALLVPTAALAGFSASGASLMPLVERIGGIQNYDLELGAMTEADRAVLAGWRRALLGGFWLMLAGTLLARWLRTRLGATYRLRHVSGRVIGAPVGRTILEALRDAGVPHASVCGGRARCTTCRVRVGEGLELLAPPGPAELRALARIQAAPNVRLACQARPSRDLAVTPLLPPEVDLAYARNPATGHGGEHRIVAMFVDLRDSARLAETRLPYDVVFLLNQFFAAMNHALRRTGGYYAQFRGDGLLALYGLQGPMDQACRSALAGAAEMQRAIEALNGSLADELAEPLRIGIGLHAGLAIVGTMGPPDTPIYSAIGDTVNIAARLEGMTKAYRCTLVVSEETLREAGIEPRDAAPHRVRVRGRRERLSVYAVADPRELIT